MNQEKIINIRLLSDWSKCNYKCSYCIVATSQEGFTTWSEDNFKTIVKNLILGSYHYNIRLGVQGEFFANKVLIQGGRELSNSKNCFGVNLITNLSLSIKQFKSAFEGYDLTKVGLVASYHPTEIEDIEAWLDTAVFMNSYVDFSLVVVAFPPILSELELMVERFHKLGMHVAVQAYIGSYAGKTYPQDYTKDEKNRIKSMMYSRHDFEFFVNLKKPDMCYAGSKSYFVNTVDGIALTCGIRTMKSRKVIGNLLDGPDVNFLTEAMSCESPSCQCDTENINTVVFHENYHRTGVNQHKFVFSGDKINNMSEWDIDY